MQMEHEKCLEIVFHPNAQIEPTLMSIARSIIIECGLIRIKNLLSGRLVILGSLFFL